MQCFESDEAAEAYIKAEEVKTCTKFISSRSTNLGLNGSCNNMFLYDCIYMLTKCILKSSDVYSMLTLHIPYRVLL
jgi:hypothetical protein